MRGIKRSVVVGRPPDAVWLWLADVRNWDSLADAFSWPRSGYRHVIGGGKAADAPLATGSEVSLLGPGGRMAWAWKVTDWSPPKTFAIVAHSDSSFSGYHLQWTLTIEPTATGGSSVHFAFYFLMHNAFFELMSLVPPTSLLYGRKAQRVVDALKHALG